MFVVRPCLEATRCFSISEGEEEGEGRGIERNTLWFPQGDRQKLESPLDVNKLSCNMPGRRGQLLTPQLAAPGRDVGLCTSGTQSAMFCNNMPDYLVLSPAAPNVP